MVRGQVSVMGTPLNRAANMALLRESLRLVRGCCALCLAALPIVPIDELGWWDVKRRKSVDVGKLVTGTLPTKMIERVAALRPVHPDCIHLARAANRQPKKP